MLVNVIQVTDGGIAYDPMLFANDLDARAYWITSWKNLGGALGGVVHSDDVVIATPAEALTVDYMSDPGGNIEYRWWITSLMGMSDDGTRHSLDGQDANDHDSYAAARRGMVSA